MVAYKIMGDRLRVKPQDFINGVGFSTDQEDGAAKALYFNAEEKLVTEVDTKDPKFRRPNGEPSYGDICNPMCDIKHMRREEVREALKYIVGLHKKDKGDGWMDTYSKGEAVRHNHCY